jgi:hypothetical protein
MESAPFGIGNVFGVRRPSRICQTIADHYSDAMTICFSRRFQTPDGLSLVADVGGRPNAPGEVLLEGGGQTRHSWAGAMRRLIERGCFVVSFDGRGHGDSDWSHDGDYSLNALASDLRAVLPTIAGPAALVGASTGGMTSFYAPCIPGASSSSRRTGDQVKRSPA